jgi:membrane protease YdiL (CAAX protease family)
LIPPDEGDPVRPADAPAPDALDAEDRADARDALDTPDALQRPHAEAPARPGSSTFTIEGRSAPALFVVGWLASVIGLGAVAIALLSGGQPAAPILLIGGLIVLALGLIAAAGSQAIERRARGVSGYRGPSPFLVFGATVPISLLAGALIGIPLQLLDLPLDGPLARLGSVAAQVLVYVALIRLLVVDVGALSWADMGVRRPDARALAELGAGALWAGPVILLTIPVAAILSQVVPVTPVSPLPPSGENTGFLINLIAGAIVAPVGEELLFRGFATTAWARTMGPRRALVRGALFFAFVHVLTISGTSAGEALGLALVGFASRIPVALALGWLFLRRQSIWAPIGLHATFNGVLIVLAEIAARSGLV